ncbi:hypothetical protein L208DRAFT_1381358 [Tricholoma matsutake]|nr:hypothetical protein L208DRAFT_1381358 [Tricholoma matsutake 945]
MSLPCLACKQQQEAANNLKAKQAKQAARAHRKQEEPDVEDDVADDGDGDPISDRSNCQSNFMLHTVQAKTNTIKENALMCHDNRVPLSELTDLNEGTHSSWLTSFHKLGEAFISLGSGL